VTNLLLLLPSRFIHELNVDTSGPLPSLPDLGSPVPSQCRFPMQEFWVRLPEHGQPSLVYWVTIPSFPGGKSFALYQLPSPNRTFQDNDLIRREELCPRTARTRRIGTGFPLLVPTLNAMVTEFWDEGTQPRSIQRSIEERIERNLARSERDLLSELELEVLQEQRARELHTKLSLVQFASGVTDEKPDR